MQNTGSRTGAEAAQVYIGLPSAANEPPKRLVGFVKPSLTPNRRTTTTVTIDPSDASHPLSYWNTTTNRWTIAPSTYKVYVGASSRDIRLSGRFTVA